MTSQINSESIIKCIQNVVGESSLSNPIALHEPDFSNTKALTYIDKCLKSGWVSTAGEWVRKFERGLCDTTNARNAIAVTNGTDALRLALHLVGVKPTDEVLVPPVSFVATTNAIAHLGASPHFVDIESTTLGLDPVALNSRLNQIANKKNGLIINKKTGKKISAIVLVHVFGHPANAPEISKIAKEWGIPLIEDAAEALGSWRSDNGAMVHCGLLGEIGTLSFNGNKIITTGGGGALITNNDELANQARHLSTTAKITHPWEYNHDMIAWNDRLPNVNAALGFAQLETFNTRLKTKRELMNNYLKEFANFDDISIIKEPKYCKSNYWLVTLRFDCMDKQLAASQRLDLLEKAHKNGLLLRPLWKLLNKLPMFQRCPSGPLPIALDQSCRLINLPSSPQLID